jgi:UDP-glucose 4-epimerase
LGRNEGREHFVRRALVTGGAGFIGSHLTEHLLARGDEVIVLDDESTGSAANLNAASKNSRLRYVQGSVSQPELLESLLEGVGEIYHLAAAVGVQLIVSDPFTTIANNIHPTEVLLTALRERHRAGKSVRLFLASSSEVYGKNPLPVWKEDDDLVFGPTIRPRWSYGMSKAIDEFLALACWREDQVPIVIGRFFNVVGPRQTGRYGMVLPRMVEAARSGKPLTVHDDGQQVRCFAHVRDVVDAVVRLTALPSAAGEIFNIGSDQPVSILELARRVVAQAGSRSPIEFQSYAEAFADDFEDVRTRVPDLSKLNRALGERKIASVDDVIAELLAID